MAPHSIEHLFNCQSRPTELTVDITWPRSRSTDEKRSAAAFGQQSSSLRPMLPAQHVWPSGFFCCWSDCLEVTARSHAGSGVFCGQLHTVTEDIFIFAVLLCLAH